MAAFLKKFMDTVRGFDRDDEYDEYEEYEDEVEESQEIQVPGETRGGFFKRQSKVVDFGKTHGNTQQVVIIQPSTIDSAQEVCNHLRAGKTVICNFEKVDQKVAQRVMDFITGATYAIDGNVHKVSSMIFVTLPKNISLMDDENPVRADYFDTHEAYAAR